MTSPPAASTILLTGASGFVGGHVLPALVNAGYQVRCASRDPERAARLQPAARWVPLDVDRPETLGPALGGCSAAIYLVHAMAAGPGYEHRERQAAHHFIEAAERCGLQRIVYLGGAVPHGEASRHLHSRLVTGEILRNGRIPVVELRAAMIIGRESLSFQIVRDLSVRLPVMVLPRWLATRSQPIAIDDVVFAIVRALALPAEKAGVYALPGPEILSAKEILLRVARLRGIRPITVSVPVLSPRLSSYWLKLVTRADYDVARELIEGLTSDLVAPDEGFWKLAPEHRLIPFDDAARRALEEQGADLPGSARLVESIVAAISRRHEAHVR
jgi:uncharacterized protein YbjT (DUF2867 family)